MVRASLAGLLLAAAAGCATAPPRAHVAASDQTVSTRLEAAYDGRGQHVLVENRSSEEIFVTSVALRECENIKNRCEVTRMRFKVLPYQTTRVTTVHVADPNKAFNFRYGWTWESAARSAAPR